MSNTAEITIYNLKDEFADNLIIEAVDGNVWPEGNRVAETMEAVGFEDAPAGNHRLKPGSPFHSPTGPGADMDALLKATAGAISGVWR